MYKIDFNKPIHIFFCGISGCTVSIVEDSALEAFKEKVGKAYSEKIGYPADFYIVEVGGGPERLL